MHGPGQLAGVREVATAEVSAQKIEVPALNPANASAKEAGRGVLGNLADYSGFSGLKRSLDDFNEGVHKTVQTINFLWEKKGWAGLALGGAYVGAPLLRVAISMARGRPDAAVGALVRYEVAQQPKGNLEALAGEAWTGTLERASDPIFMEAMQMAAGAVILAPFKKGGKLQRNLSVYSGGAPKTPFWTPKT